MISNASEFFQWDYANTLFPLKLNQLLVEKFSPQLMAFIQEHKSFLPQHRVFASKKGWYLRRTVKLDPVAEFFIYDIVYRNRKLFKTSEKGTRQVHGFRIVKGDAISGIQSYAEYKSSLAFNRLKYKHYAYFDVASYFNHIYHHDLVKWFEEWGANETDVAMFGAFLREIAGGRSIDCLPQGIYPSKMIGSAFLTFLEASPRIQSAQTVRLMDDMWLFDNSEKVLISDFIQVQALLSERGLSLNDSKSHIGGYIENQLDVEQMKIDLLRKRRERIKESSSYWESWDEDDNDDDDGEEDDRFRTVRTRRTRVSTFPTR
jgi:hypothetical protein